MKQIFESARVRYVEVSERLIRDYLVMVNDIEHVQRFFGGTTEPYTAEQERAWVREKLEELSKEPVDKAKNLEKKYEEAGKTASVDEELAKMKAELGL